MRPRAGVKRCSREKWDPHDPFGMVSGWVYTGDVFSARTAAVASGRPLDAASDS